MTMFKDIRIEKDLIRNARGAKSHVWVTVVDPSNHRTLLQACDDCGVVKSENSVIRNCRAARGRAVISSARDQQLAYVV